MKLARMWFFGTLCIAFALVSAGQLHAQEEASVEMLDMLIELVKDPDKDMRSLALDQIREGVPGKAATERLAEQLPDLSAEAQVGLLSALGDRGDTAARDAVAELLGSNKDASVRLAAISALGPLGGADDIKTLVALLDAGTKEEQATARESLIQLQGETVSAEIGEAVKTAKTPVRVTLMEVLATRRGLETIPVLLAEAIGDDPIARGAAMAALGQLGGPNEIPGMVQGVLKAAPGKEREAAEKCVMFVCQENDDKEKQAEPLIAAINDLEPADQIAMLPTLGRVGGREAAMTVREALGSSDPAMHAAAISALCNWPDSLVVPWLVSLAKTDAHPDHRLKALRALIRIAPLNDGRTDEQKLQTLYLAMSLCTRASERNLVLQRAAAIRTAGSLRFILPYTDYPPYAEQAYLSIVELAHHRELREAHKDEFFPALEKAKEKAADEVVRDRANRYLNNQTWVRPGKE